MRPAIITQPPDYICWRACTVEDLGALRTLLLLLFLVPYIAACRACCHA